MVTLRFTLTFCFAAALGALAPDTARGVELLDFYYPGCGPCQAMEPVVRRLESEGVSVRKVNGVQQPGLTQQLGIDSYPTFVAMSGGREVGRLVGATSYESLKQMLQRAQRDAGASTPARSQASPQAVSPASWSSGGAAPVAASPTSSAGAELLNSSVRLTIEDPAGRAFGTGTLIDAREGEALVVTCAHLFRDERGQPITSGVSVELFDASTGALRVRQRVAGTLVAHDFEADVALVAIRPTGKVAVAPVAARVDSIAVGTPVRSVGCDLGADPTVRDSRVVSLNRYNGPPNIEASGAPVQGRSGGGLFNARGEVIGVCFAADEEADEGLYSGLASIHKQLEQIGMSAIYRGASPAAIASEPATGSRAAPAAPAPTPAAEPIARVASNDGATGGLSPIGNAASQPVLRAQNATGPLPAAERAALDEIVSQSESGSVVIMIQPRGGGPTEVMTLDKASPEFLAALRRMRGESTRLR